MRGATSLLLTLALLFFGKDKTFAQDMADSTGKVLSADTVRKVLPPDSLATPLHYHRKSHWGAGLTFQSDDVYLGRKDSIALPYYTPSVSYYHKSGFFTTASLSYLKNATASRIDLVTIDAGYMFTVGKYAGSFTASKYFYNSQSTSITSAIQASMEYQSSYDFGFIKPSLTTTLNIGSKTDFSAQLGLSHTFEIIKDKLEMSPSFSGAASTQDFYNDYYKERKYQVKKKKQIVQTGMAAITGTVVNPSAFKILAYEASAPIEYTAGNCTISFTPSYAIAVHPANLDIHSVRDNGQVFDTSRIEKLNNTFFFTLGVDFLF